ncbi:MAG: hypothetical protein AAF153_01260 [Pseudomonadota bacterium]
MWVHLYESGIFTDTPYFTDHNWSNPTPISENYNFSDLFPKAIIGEDNILAIIAKRDCQGMYDATRTVAACNLTNGDPLIVNEIVILGKGNSVSGNGANIRYEGSLTLYEAYTIDIKLDDGFPETGTVMSYNGEQANKDDFYNILNTSNCFDNRSGSMLYNLSNTYAIDACKIAIQLGY